MLVVLAAYITDLLIGDPRWLPHPVVYIGRFIAFGERQLRRVARGSKQLRVAGGILAVLVVGSSYFITLLLLQGAAAIHPWLAAGLEIWLISTTMAVRGLAGAAARVLSPLIRGDLDLARQQVGWIVGRDTAQMGAPEVIRATVETVAENIVDGFVSPLFYALIGGAPLAMAYRAVNTLDSMVGYRNELYRDLGWASARLDDVVNYLPARWAGWMLVLAAWLSGRRAGEARQAIKRDAGRHPSPNSGIPEAAMAGALGIRLGGLNFYGGRPSFRPYMNESGVLPGTDHIRRAVDMLYLSSFLALTSGLAAAWAFRSLWCMCQGTVL
ncbi:cobalamin biosynthesis protein CobD [Desulfofundulus thermobenzoicus]|uniref:Cobalamin biosynthesis protein CobD n=1 Tax=Desulfofundulus thermobenzoicus TaxID=29376 RepID=A0A6N7IRU7_9FIRM|nr:adenosylcobinamide-phosphate synthase CbiB [Desulfofundulus thermobenzoicus]MQL52855.1 cobalamin biosynthesis protein CobD [Desulfofundulus thermobenzoicus]HHW42408.1 cobalamin biosynthesis protein CobD [Desulfotomaculum sp.]